MMLQLTPIAEVLSVLPRDCCLLTPESGRAAPRGTAPRRAAPAR